METSSSVQKKLRNIFRHTGHKKILSESNENFMENGSLLLEEKIKLFDGRTNPIRYYSVDELNAIITHVEPTKWAYYEWYDGVIDGRSVLIKAESKQFANNHYRDIAVGTQMSSHKNVLTLVGCCLDTQVPVLVFEAAQNGRLADRVSRDENQSKGLLEWKDRLRIAWEISHAVAYLHTAFSRPIIHRDLKPHNVFLDHENAAKLTGFELCISIPKGETHVDDGKIIGTIGFIAPEYMTNYKVSEKADVYAFGMLFLELLTGLEYFQLMEEYTEAGEDIFKFVKKLLKHERICEIIDPAIIGKGVMADEGLSQQVQASLELILRCRETEEDSRPTMVEVATQIKNIITLEPDFCQTPEKILSKPVASEITTFSCYSLARSGLFLGNRQSLLSLFFGIVFLTLFFLTE